MPLVSPIDIAVLSSPIPLPGETSTVTPGSFDASTQQNFTAITKGSGVTSPIGTGNEMMPSQTFNTAAEYGNIEGKALESGGANVGGLVKTEQKVIPTDIKFATAEDENLAKQEDQYEDQVDEYDKAFKGEGEMMKNTLEQYDKAKELANSKIYNKFAESKLGQKLDDKIQDKIKDKYSGMSGARRVKRQDRKDDKQARKDAGLKGKEKRLARKAQRKNRKSAYKDFKEGLLDESYADITNLEN